MLTRCSTALILIEGIDEFDQIRMGIEAPLMNLVNLIHDGRIEIVDDIERHEAGDQRQTHAVHLKVLGIIHHGFVLFEGLEARHRRELELATDIAAEEPV